MISFIYMISFYKKRQNIKIDFNRWKDEDESDDEGGMYDDASLEDMMQQMGTGAGAGSFDPGEMGDSEDSDDEGKDTCNTRITRSPKTSAMEC